MPFFNFSTFSTVANFRFVTMPAASNTPTFSATKAGAIGNPHAGKLLPREIYGRLKSTDFYINS